MHFGGNWHWRAGETIARKNLLYLLVLSFDLTPLWPNFLKKTERALTKLQCSAALMNASVQKQSQPLKSPLFPPKQKSCYLLLISSLFFCVPGEALQHGPFQQLPPNNKNIVLFYFIYFFPPLHLSGAITLPYSAYDPGAMGGGTHWPWKIMSFHTAEISELHTSLVVVLQLFGFLLQYGRMEDSSAPIVAYW